MVHSPTNYKTSGTLGQLSQPAKPRHFSIVLDVANFKNMVCERTILDHTCFTFGIYKLLPRSSGNVGHAEKENKLPAKGICNANMLCIQM